MIKRWWRKPICWIQGHRYLGWVKVLVCRPDWKPKEFNTCEYCGYFKSRKVD